MKAGLAILAARLSARRRRELLVVAVLTPLSAIAEVASLAALVPLLTNLSTAGRDVAVPLAMFAAFILAAMLFRLWLAWSTYKFAHDVGHDLNVEVQRRVLHQPYGFHVDRHSSQLLGALEKVETLVATVIMQGIQSLSAMLVGGGILLTLLFIDARAAFAGVAFLTIVYGVSALAVRRRLARDGRIVGDGFDQRIRAIQEGLGGIRDVILDRSQQWHVDRFRTIDRALADARARSQTLAMTPRYVAEAVGLIGIAALAMWLSQRSGGLAAALPVLGALALGAQRLLPLAQQLFQGWSGIAVGRAALDDVASLLALEVPRDRQPPLDMPFEQSIRLDDVSFAYHGRLPALAGIDLTIERGERIVLVGPSGSGKSTLADLVMGLIGPSRGRISVDGVELDRDNIAAWQRNIAHVAQHVFLADATIADNVMLGAQAHDPVRLAASLKAAHLGEFIAGLPQGVDTFVGERGARLSGGQRQRIGLARAVYRAASLLVLDEPFSALDETTERAVLDALDVLHAAGTTILIISHRASAVSASGRTIRLEQGRIAG